MTAITPRESNTLQLAAQAMQLFDFGGMLIKSGMLPSSVRSPEAAVAIMVKGMELGLPAMAALNGITVIQGKPTVSPQLMLSLINRSGQLDNIEIETSPQGATVTMKRRGRTPFTAKFGPAEAQAMGLHTKDNYKKQAPVMYQWRAVAACARVVFPDVIDGLYTPEEMGADVQVDEDGAMTVTVQQETKLAPAGPDEMEARMKVYGPKLAARREAIKKYGIKDAEVTQFLADLPDWRASDENAERAVSKLTEWGTGLKAAQVSESETQDVVDAELKPVPEFDPQPTKRPEPTDPIGTERAQKLHKYLGTVVKGTEYQGKHDVFAGEALGREVTHLQDITNEEARLLNDYIDVFKSEQAAKGEGE